MKIVDSVNHPSHYRPLFKSRSIECIEIARLLPYNHGCAFKYVWRAGSKGDKQQAIQDLEKAKWYITDARDNMPYKKDEIFREALIIFNLTERGKGKIEEKRWEVLLRILCNGGTWVLKEIDEFKALIEEH